MKLNRLISDVDVLRMTGEPGREISHIAFDSRKTGPGSLFVAIRGTHVDGHLYIPAALESGATAIVFESKPPGKVKIEEHPQVTWVEVKNSRIALAGLASAFYRHPSREIRLVGVTGTNGKTTIASLLHQLHTGMGFRSGLLSTIEVHVSQERKPATHTTPDPLRINELLREMVTAGCDYCFMEVSSHAIDQERIGGLRFAGGIFTNLSRDHLDYHPDFRSYLEVKKRFFDGLPEDAFALVNGDDKYSRVMLQNCRAGSYRYGLQTLGDFTGRIREMHLEGTSLEMNDTELWIRLPGRFNASNMLAVYGASVLLGQRPGEVQRAISRLTPVSGRFETVRSEGGPTGIVDYAHSPDALKNVLETLNEVHQGPGRIITVVGAGGNRDRGKRPRMARIAAEGSHQLILTSDNPRDEDPEQILDDMMEGVPHEVRERTLRISSREEAIRTACVMAGAGDIILVAGKGHEKTQEVKGEKKPFDDLAILKKQLKR